MSLIYNPDTLRQLDMLRATPPHAMLLTGIKGVGLFSVAKDFAGERLAEVIRPTDSKGDIDEQGGSIRVDAIRALYVHTKGKGKHARFFIIDDADKMNETAQNALLKLLEEPAPSVHFILTSHTPDALLATVLSRVERIVCKPLEQAQVAALMADIDDAKSRAQLLFLADGLPAEIIRLRADKNYFDSRSTLIRDAQTLVAGKSYDRIVIAFSYASDRARTLGLLEAAQLILKHSLTKSPSTETIARAGLLVDTYDAIRANGNVRLQLLRFMV